MPIKLRQRYLATADAVDQVNLASDAPLALGAVNGAQSASLLDPASNRRTVSVGNDAAAANVNLTLTNANAEAGDEFVVISDLMAGTGAIAVLSAGGATLSTCGAEAAVATTWRSVFAHDGADWTLVSSDILSDSLGGAADAFATATGNDFDLSTGTYMMVDLGTGTGPFTVSNGRDGAVYNIWNDHGQSVTVGGLMLAPYSQQDVYWFDGIGQFVPATFISRGHHLGLAQAQIDAMTVADIPDGFTIWNFDREREEYWSATAQEWRIGTLSVEFLSATALGAADPALPTLAEVQAYADGTPGVHGKWLRYTGTDTEADDTQMQWIVGGSGVVARSESRVSEIKQELHDPVISNDSGVTIATKRYFESTEDMGAVTGTIVPNFSELANVKMELAGATTINTLNGMVDGKSWTIFIKQDATGAHALTFGPAIIFPDNENGYMPPGAEEAMLVEGTYFSGVALVKSVHRWQQTPDQLQLLDATSFNPGDPADSVLEDQSPEGNDAVLVGSNGIGTQAASYVKASGGGGVLESHQPFELGWRHQEPAGNSIQCCMFSSYDAATQSGVYAIPHNDTVSGSVADKTLVGILSGPGAWIRRVFDTPGMGDGGMHSYVVSYDGSGAAAGLSMAMDGVVCVVSATPSDSLGAVGVLNNYDPIVGAIEGSPGNFAAARAGWVVCETYLQVSGSDVLRFPFADGAGSVAFDASGGGNHGRVVGMSWGKQDSYHRNLALGFSRYIHWEYTAAYNVTTNTRIDVPPLALTGDFTCAFLAALGKEDQFMFGGHPTNAIPYLMHKSSGGRWYTKQDNGSFAQFTTTDPTGADFVGVPTWYVMTKSGTTVTLYRAGAQLGVTGTQNGTMTLGVIGCNTNRHYAFSGTMFDAILWDGYALSAAEVATLSATSALPATAPTRRYEFQGMTDTVGGQDGTIVSLSAPSHTLVPPLANGSGNDIVGKPLTNPAGNFHNGAETLIVRNPAPGNADITAAGVAVDSTVAHGATLGAFEGKVIDASGNEVNFSILEDLGLPNLGTAKYFEKPDGTFAALSVDNSNNTSVTPL